MNEQGQPPGAGFETAVVGVGAAVCLAGFVTWLGARLACMFTFGDVYGGLGDWLPTALRLARGESPRTAWGTLASDLPAAWLYWTCTIVVLLAAAGVVVGLVIAWRRLDNTWRRRFGQDTEARQATPKDVAPLKVDDIVPPTGRMLLGRMIGHDLLLAARSTGTCRNSIARRRSGR